MLDYPATKTDYYFTFCEEHCLRTNVNGAFKISLGNRYVKITADNEVEASIIMNNLFGQEWAFCYTWGQFELVKNQYNLTELKINKVLLKAASGEDVVESLLSAGKKV